MRAPQVRGCCCSRGARGRPCTGAGPERRLWPSLISKPNTHREHNNNYALIMSLSSLQLPMRPSSCKLKLEAELNSDQSDPPCCCNCHCSPNCNTGGGRHNFLRCAGKEDLSIMEVGLGPARKNNSNSGRQFYARPPSARLLLQQGRTGAAAHRGRAGWPDMLAELELKATHTHVCIDHDLIHELEWLANEARQLRAQARGRAQLGSIRPPLLLQLPRQPQLQYRRWQAQFSSLRRQGRPINNGHGSGTRTKK